MVRTSVRRDGQLCCVLFANSLRYFLAITMETELTLAKLCACFITACFFRIFVFNKDAWKLFRMVLLLLDLEHGN